MVITIHMRNTGWFAFLGFLSESEMLHLGGMHYSSNCERYDATLTDDISNRLNSVVPIKPIPRIVCLTQTAFWRDNGYNITAQGCHVRKVNTVWSKRVFNFPSNSRSIGLRWALLEVVH
jgi:hypothetical protein